VHHTWFGIVRSICVCATVGSLLTASFACVSTRDGLDREALMDPAYCQNCHSEHYRQWSGSMHAYASDDPMFIAMNERLQRETDGEAAGLCVGCHAPLAVRTGATVDGLNIRELPRRLRGVTCFFCHSVDAVAGDHNNQLHLADDGIMRGGHRDPMSTEAHSSMYSPLQDSNELGSSSLCGTCHDVVLPNGLQLERTFAEWRGSLFSKSGVGALSCSRCHLPGYDGPAADVVGAPNRRLHQHQMPGIDMALSAWPEGDDQRVKIERDLFPSVLTNVCVQPGAGGIEINVIVDNVFAGHAWPSGTTHARRAWVHLVAYSGGDVIFESGGVGAGDVVSQVDDPNLWLMRSKMFDGDGNEVVMPWQAASTESTLLPAAVTNDPADPAYYHAKERVYTLSGASPDRVTMTLNMRPVGLDVVDSLIASGDLAAAVRDRVQTLEITPASVEWTADMGFGCVRNR